MKPQTQLLLLLLLASIAAALVMSRGVLAGAGTHAVMPVRTVEDDDVGFAEREEAAYPQRRVLASYTPTSIGYGALEANKAACYGSCPGRGQPYTGRGCKAIFGCRGR